MQAFFGFFWGKNGVESFRGGIPSLLILCGFVSLCDYFSPFPVPRFHEDRFHEDKSYLLKNIFAENVKIIVIRC